MADEASRSQLSGPLDKLEIGTRPLGEGSQQRRFAGSRWALKEDVPTRAKRREQHLDLSPPANDGSSESVDGGGQVDS